MKPLAHLLLLALLVAAAAGCSPTGDSGGSGDDAEAQADEAAEEEDTAPADEPVDDDCNSAQLRDLLEEVGAETADPFEHGKVAQVAAEGEYGADFESVCSPDDFAYHIVFEERFCKWKCENGNYCLLKQAAESEEPGDDGPAGDDEPVDDDCLSARLKEIINEAGAADSDPFAMGKAAQGAAADEFAADYEAVCSPADFAYHIRFKKRMCKVEADNGNYCLLKQN